MFLLFLSPMSTVHLLSQVIDAYNSLKQSLPSQVSSVEWKQFVNRFNSHSNSLKREILTLVGVLEPLKIDFESCILQRNTSMLTGLIGGTIVQLNKFDERVTKLLKKQKQLLNKFVGVIYHNPYLDLKKNMEIFVTLDFDLLKLNLILLIFP